MIINFPNLNLEGGGGGGVPVSPPTLRKMVLQTVVVT